MNRLFFTLSFLLFVGCLPLDASWIFRDYRADDGDGSLKPEVSTPVGQGKKRSIANQTPWGCCCYTRIWEKDDVTIESSGCNCCKTFSLCCCAKKTVVEGNLGVKEVSVLCCIRRDMER